MTTAATPGGAIWLTHARFGLMNALLLWNAATLLVGGGWLWTGFAAAVLLATAADEAAGDDLELLREARVGWLEAQLQATLPLLALNVLLYVQLWGSGDPLGTVAALRLVGLDVEAARAVSGGWSMLGATLALGLLIGAAGTNVAHELVHRTGDRRSMLAGRILLSFSWDTSFAIEHVHGHHRTVGTDADPATARRGETALGFALRSAIDGNRSAWRIETERLARKGRPVWSARNRFLRGQAISALVTALAFLIGGPSGGLAFLCCAAQGKLYLELVNYVEHYGLVRVPGARIEARHAWNCNRLLSAALLYNLPRHSHHHLFASKPFWTLAVEPDAPVTPFGYKVMILIALVPPVWRRLMHPRLARWDAGSASAEERALLAARGRLLG
jgi:alkane 1-monooxygenase